MGSERLDVVASRFDVFLVRLDPTEGREIRKRCPGLIISPEEMNHHIDTVIITPMTTKKRPSTTRGQVRFKGKSGQIVLNQSRTVDKTRLVKRLGKVESTTKDHVLAVLAELFAP